MSNFAFYTVAFLVVLGVLIVVHELGHYTVARLCGVKVLRFSVGFGRAVWQRRLGVDKTEWAIGIFPLGGYVKMLDEREGKVAPGELHRAFNRQPVGKRSAIVAGLSNTFESCGCTTSTRGNCSTFGSSTAPSTPAFSEI